MGPPRRIRLGGIMLGLLVGIVLSCSNFNDQELQCEEAVSRLENCCSNIDGQRFACVETQSCNGVQTPDLTDEASSCIRKRSCEELKSRGICDALVKISKDPYPSGAHERIQAEVCK